VQACGTVRYCTDLCCVCLSAFASATVLYCGMQVVKEVVDPAATVVYRENTADDPHKRKPDIAEAREFLGWEPKIALREGLQMMVEDFRRRGRREWGHSQVSRSPTGAMRGAQRGYSTVQYSTVLRLLAVREER